MRMENGKMTQYPTDNARKVDVKNLDNITVELASISDVSGAAVVGTDGTVLSRYTRKGIDLKEYIEMVFDFLFNSDRDRISNYRAGMFTQNIIDYNGHKILFSRIKDNILLLLVLEKQAYLGLTMLDMEGCMRDLEGVLVRCCS